MAYIKRFLTVLGWLLLVLITGFTVLEWIADKLQIGLMHLIEPATGGVALAGGSYLVNEVWSWIIAMLVLILVVMTVLSIFYYRSAKARVLTSQEEHRLRESVNNLERENRELKDAYEQSCKGVSRVVYQLYPEYVRHHISKLVYECSVEANGDCNLVEHHTVTAVEHPVQFWKTGVTADAESPEMPFVEKLGLRFEDLGASDVVYVPMQNAPRQKEVAVFFLPEIQPKDSREIRRTYSWPGFIRHLLDDKEVTFYWSYETVDPDGLCDLKLIFNFHPDIGDVECTSGGTVIPGQQPQKTVTGKTTVWTYQLTQVRLATTHNSLTFKRRKKA